MNAAKRQKIMERIRKMIALSTDPGTTEGERIAARHQARKLMEEYCISHLEDPEVTDKSIIEENYVPYPGMIINRDLFEVLPHILLPIAQYFGCFVVIHVENNVRYETFCGFRPNVEMVQYAVNVVLRQGIEEAKSQYREHRSITFYKSFWIGFALGIEEKFKRDTEPSEQGLILYDRVKNFVDELTGGKKANMDLDFVSRRDFIQAGKEFGKHVTVHHAVGHTGSKGNLIK